MLGGAAAPWWVGGSLGAVLLLFVVIAFPRRRSRALAAVTLLPLAAIAGLVAWSGRATRAEASDAQEAATSFGDGAQTPGASHAAATGVAGGEPAATPSAGPDLAAALARAAKETGATLSQGPEAYTPSTLWNRIDGGAELYTKRGMARALFATLTKGETDFEVQLFELRSEADAVELWAFIDRDVWKPHAAGDVAVTWLGGGELRAKAVYGRVVATSAAPTESDAAVIGALLDTLGAALPAGAPNDSRANPAVLPQGPGVAATPAAEPGAAAATAPPAGGEPDPEAPNPEAPNPESPSAEPQAGAAGAELDQPAGPVSLPEFVVELYGVGAPEALTSGLIRRKTRGPLEAWALCQATRPLGAEDLGRFGWWKGSAGMVPQGAAIVTGGNTPEALAAAATPPLHPTLAAFAEGQALRVHLSGWAGRGALGPTLVGIHANLQVFVAAPRDTRRALAALQATLSEPTTVDGVLSGTDPYSGQVLATRVGKLLVGVSGNEPTPDLRVALDAATQRLAAISP